jgi:hypothetical protein
MLSRLEITHSHAEGRSRGEADDLRCKRGDLTRCGVDASKKASATKSIAVSAIPFVAPRRGGDPVLPGSLFAQPSSRHSWLSNNLLADFAARLRRMVARISWRRDPRRSMMELLLYCLCLGSGYVTCWFG